MTGAELAAALLASEDSSLPVHLVDYSDFRAFEPKKGVLMIEAALSPDGQRVLAVEVREVTS